MSKNLKRSFVYLFIMLLPRISRNLEYYLSEDMDEDETHNLINTLMQKVLQDESFSRKLSPLQNIDEIKEVLFFQSSRFISFFVELTSSDLDVYQVDQSLINILKDAITWLLNLQPNSKGLEYSIIDARSEYRANSRWLQNYKDFRLVSEKVLLDIENVKDNFVPAILFNLSQALEKAINDIQQTRTLSGFVNLIYVDTEWRMFQRGDSYDKAVAKLTLERTSMIGKLTFNKYANLIDRRSAQRIAQSICKFGFELPDKSRVGVNYRLEMDNEEFY